MESKHRHTHPDTARLLSEAEAAAAFSALGSDARLAILRVLVRAGQEGVTVGVLQNRTGIMPSTLSHHVKALVTAGVITQERVGRSLICRARFEWIEALAQFLIKECCADAKAPGYFDRVEETLS